MAVSRPKAAVLCHRVSGQTRGARRSTVLSLAFKKGPPVPVPGCSASLATTVDRRRTAGLS